MHGLLGQWGRQLRWLCWRRWRPVIASPILNRSLRRDLPDIPAPRHFGESDLGYRSRWLRRGRRWPAETNQLCHHRHLALLPWLGQADGRRWLCRFSRLRRWCRCCRRVRQDGQELLESSKALIRGRGVGVPGSDSPFERSHHLGQLPIQL